MSKNRAGLVITIVAVITGLLSGCGGGGSSSGGSDHGDGSFINILESEEKENCDQDEPTFDCKVDFSGEVFNEYYPNSEVGDCSFPDNWVWPWEVGVYVEWKNQTTGESGEGEVLWRSDSFWGYCWSVWEADDIPLAKGANTIVFTATGTSGRIASVEKVEYPSSFFDPVENFKADIQGTSVTFTWDNDPDASSYNLYYSTGFILDSSGDKLLNLTSPYVLDGLDEGENYYFFLNAILDSYEVFSTRQEGQTGWYSCDLLDLGMDAEISIDDSDGVHIFSQSDSGIGSYLNYTSGQWINIETDTDPDQNAALGLDTNQIPHIIYVDGSDLKYAYLVAGNWTSSVIESGRVYRDPHLQIDNKGKAHIVYYADTEVTYANNLSDTWEITIINSDSSEFYLDLERYRLHTAIELDQSGYVHLAYVIKGTRNNTLNELVYVTNMPGYWQETILADYRGNVEMKIDGLGYVHIISQHSGVGGGGLSYLTNKSGDWYSSRISNPYGNRLYSMEIDSHGNPHIIFSKHSAEAHLMHGFNAGAGWEYRALRSDNVGVTGSFDTAIDANDQIHILYSEDGGVTRYMTNRIGGQLDCPS